MDLSKNRRIVFILATGGLLTLVAILLALRPVRAAGPWYVAPGGDDGNDCLSPGAPCATINGAIGKASPGDTIYVAIGTYTGTGDQVVLVDKDATLSGGWDETFTEQSGRTTVDGESARRGILVNSENCIIDNFTVRNGFSGQGGGIWSSATLTLNRSTISANTSTGSAGGIWNGLGALTLNDSTVSDNTANGSDFLSGGGGIYNHSGTLTLNNSTVSGNWASMVGGGIRHRGDLTLCSSTVSDNSSYSGGGIYNADGSPVTLQNSILAGNTADNTGSDCSGAIGSSGYNLIGDTSGCTFTPGTGDLTDVHADLGLLLGLQSTPWYHPLLLGSPAIDAGNPAGCTDHMGNPLDTDQRGAPRVGRCDMGAYEYVTPGLAESIFAFEGTPQRTPPSLPFDTSLQAAVLDSIGSPVDDVTVTFTAPASGASGIFGDSGTSTTTAVTDGGGIAAAATFTANYLSGSYVVEAAVIGVTSPANFSMRNIGWYVSTSGNDGNDCQTGTTPCATVNGVLDKAGFVAGDTVLVAIGTYVGTGDEVVLLDQDVTLSGGWDASFTDQSGTSTIDGEDERRGIVVNGGVTAMVERFTVRNGKIGWESGGGISNSGTLILNHCNVTGNRTTGGRGGGIGNGGTLTLNSSAVTGNIGGAGGGIDNTYGTLILNNSTVSGNSAGLDNGGGIYNYATMSLNSSTISGNTASSGGGICSGSGSAILRNTILAGNTTAWGGPDCTGSISSSGYNLVGDTTDCTFTATTGDLTDVDAKLFALIGLPGYHPLVPGSPAIDAGDPAGCTDHLGNPLITDQRGSPRPLDGDDNGSAICDMGSYEFDPANNPITAVFLPCVARNFCSCPDFFDDFGNPASGWTIVDNSSVRTEYLNGEYRILTKPWSDNRFMAPTCDRNNHYVVEVDVRWVSTSDWSLGGLIFGVTSDFSRFYSFGINTEDNQFEFGDYHPWGWQTWSDYSSAINGGTASNHLKATLHDDQVTLEVNGTELGTWAVEPIGDCTGVGLMTRGDDATSDARFDNFSVTGLPASGVSVQGPTGAMDEVSGLAVRDAWHDPVPADMAW